MRLLASLALGLLGLAAGVVAQDESAAIELDRLSLNKLIKESEVVMVDWYAPWCGHCIKFAPKYEAAAKALKEKDLNVKLGKVDCTKHNKLCQEYNIRAYPTMKIFKSGQELYHDYDGPRRVSAIVDFMAKQVLPTVSTLASQRAHDQFLKRERQEVALVGYLEGDDAANTEILRAAAEKLHEDYPIGITSNAAAAQAAGVSFPALVLYKPDNEGTVVFSKNWEVDAIKDFAKTGYKPLIGETGAESWRKYVSGSDGPTVFLFHKNDDDRKKLSSELRSLAKKHQGAVQFATAEIPDFQGFANYLHLRTEPSDDAFPALAIYDGANKKKYPFDNSKGALDEKNVASFVENFLSGKVQPTIKSEDVPSGYEGPVTKVVAQTFDDVVLDGNKDVLLYYHREDCPFCRAMNPQYETLASMYSAPDRANRVAIAKMDIMKNDLFEEIPYVPFIRLYKAGDDKSGNAVTYSGDRSVKDLVAFVKDHGTHGVDALQEHAVDEDAVHGAGGGLAGSEQAPMVMDSLHEQPLQGRTPVRHIHDEL
ncbi:thioredoxin-domain-containing protein [Cryphonectria parasitica EP155]|uniref:Protein disulfide-isomerase n=1 Tax=Cryphonectria parasitica (strain ATCC 38755 / EP155) TaxID=660469 RepID=A0A9P4Y493_CRYP1|nr:thioredoxin-domain-containing protein [Cryphonectria parasitica EP155]KAF3766408.1 thioredoxin-domain-containing protein [Cryphonectria parasitica EP155]